MPVDSLGREDSTLDPTNRPGVTAELGLILAYRAANRALTQRHSELNHSINRLQILIQGFQHAILNSSVELDNIEARFHIITSIRLVDFGLQLYITVGGLERVTPTVFRTIAEKLALDEKQINLPKHLLETLHWYYETLCRDTEEFPEIHFPPPI